VNSQKGDDWVMQVQMRKHLSPNPSQLEIEPSSY
jgi:hypothetical protein